MKHDCDKIEATQQANNRKETEMESQAKHYEIWWSYSEERVTSVCQCFDYDDALAVWDAMSSRFCYVVLYKVLDNGEAVRALTHKRG